MAGDLYFPQVALLLFGNAFQDLSYSKSGVHPGPVTLTNAFPGVLASSYWFQRTFTGVSFYSDHPDAAIIHDSEDFTVEVVAYVQRNTTGGALFSTRSAGGVADGILLGIDGNSRPFLRASAGGVLKIAIDAPNKVSLEALHTFKFHRKSGIWGLSVDGVPQIDLRHQPRWTDEVPHSTKIYLGCDPYTTGFVGGVNAVRMTVGEAREVGSYSPSIEPWPIFATDPNILFGPLSTDVSTRNTTLQITVEIDNAQSVSVAAVDGGGSNVGANWAIVPNNIAGQSSYKITGTAPNALADYFLVLTGTTGVDFGSLTRNQSYRIHNTATGALDAEQSLLAAFGGAKLWIDSSDATSMTTSGTDITQVINKIDSIPFTPAAARPKPTLDATSMAYNCIRFPENASSGLVAAVPIVLSDAQSDSTIVLVGKYVGAQLGQGTGLFQISYSDDDAREDGTAAWVIATTQTGVDNASASMYDSTARQNGVGSSPVIVPGEQFVLAWNTASNKANIWLQQQPMVEVELSGTLGFWSAVSAAIGFIGGSQNPTGSPIALGELIALNMDLAQDGNESKLEQLISFLNHKWSVFPNVPFAATPSVLSGYVSNPYAATTVLTDATSVTLSASAGSNWLIAPTGSAVPGEYLITGLLPAVPTTVTLTLNSSNGGVPGVDDYQIQVQALPTTPTIQAPLNLQAQAGSGFASLLNIFSADTVSVVGSAGSNWAIAPSPTSSNGNYVLTGIAPQEVGSFTLTVNASKLDPTSGVVVETIALFTVMVSANVVVEPDEYPIDLTGVLPSNLISNEQQTLTPANGVKHQLLVPIFAPYFGNSLTLQYYSPSGIRVAAVKGVDYVSVMKQAELSDLCAADIYSGILILNPDLRGTMLVTYQTLGGGFGVDRRSILQTLAVISNANTFIGWNAITGKPVFFPVSDHYLSIEQDTVGLADVVTALESVRTALAPLSESDVTALNTHTTDTSNPHVVTKAQLGLPNVQNFPPASDAEAQLGASAQRYLTPHSTAQAIDANLPAAQDTVRGKFELNLGTLPGDDTDNAKPLTGSGVVSLLISPTPNALNVLFSSLINQAEQAVQVSPSPVVYPLWWKGIQCQDQASFISAVRSYTGLRALRYNSINGVFYFPVDVTPPSLVTTQSYSASGEVGATVRTAVALPLKLTN